MTNPFKPGSAPGRAQSADLRPGSFKQGHEKRGGRKRGTPNLFANDFREIYEAAYRIGEDGNGKNGFVGYFTWVALYHPRIFGGVLLTNLVLLELAEGDTPREPCRTIEEINDGVRDYIGLTSKNRATGQQSEPPWAWTGQPFPVGSLMQVAVENPKAFCTLFAALLRQRRLALLREQREQPGRK
jgi:hypothetical protein